MANKKLLKIEHDHFKVICIVLVLNKVSKEVTENENGSVLIVTEIKLFDNY